MQRIWIEDKFEIFDGVEKVFGKPYQAICDELERRFWDGVDPSFPGFAQMVWHYRNNPDLLFDDAKKYRIRTGMTEPEGKFPMVSVGEREYNFCLAHDFTGMGLIFNTLFCLSFGSEEGEFRVEQLQGLSKYKNSGEYKDINSLLLTQVKAAPLVLDVFLLWCELIGVPRVSVLSSKNQRFLRYTHNTLASLLEDTPSYDNFCKLEKLETEDLILRAGEKVKEGVIPDDSGILQSDKYRIIAYDSAFERVLKFKSAYLHLLPHVARKRYDDLPIEFGFVTRESDGNHVLELRP